MAIKEVSVTIDDHQYLLKQLGAIQGRRFILRLYPVLSPTVKSFEGRDHLNEDTYVAAAAAALDNLDVQLIDDLTEAFAKCSKVKVGEVVHDLPAVFDQHFAGAYSSMGKWFWACLKLNFTDFLAESTVDNPAVAAIKARFTGSKPPKTPTGTSGG